jgi:hypothetical protein
MEIDQYKKERIIGRLRQSTARIWGYEESGIQGFDPVIDLLLGACASELERLAVDANAAQTRILERISQILLPDVHLGPTPAYLVLQAKPANPERYTASADQFTYDKDFVNTSNQPSQRKLCFSPSGRYRLIDAEVDLLATNREIRKYTNTGPIDRLIQSGKNSPSGRSSIWLGLKTNPGLKTLKNLTFYVDWRGNPAREDLAKMLDGLRLFSNGEEISILHGLEPTGDNYDNPQRPDIQDFHDINRTLETKIKAILEPNFVSIASDVLPDKCPYPPVFQDLFEESDLTKLKEGLCWIEFKLPDTFPGAHLASTSICINAFPALNRRLHSSTRPFTVNQELNILPVITDDLFLSVREIISSNQIRYLEVPFKRINELAPGSFSVRTHGIKRFDERDAYDHVVYLLELLREEQVAFRSLGSSLLEKELNELQVIINRINLNIGKAKNGRASTHFLILKSDRVEDIWLEYWSTAGSFANNIPAESLFQHADFDKKSLKTLAVSTGGKNEPDQVDKIFQFKNMLLSSNRVVTREDILAICRAEAGKDIDEIRVSPGWVRTGTGRNQGLQKHVRVWLKFREGTGEETKAALTRHVGKVLEMKSSCLYPYHVVSD